MYSMMQYPILRMRKRSPGCESRGMEEKEMDWIAYCTTCHKEIDRAPNGAMVEAAGRLHIRGLSRACDMSDPEWYGPHPDHEVIVGIEVTA